MKKVLVVGANSTLAQEVIPVLAKNNTIITAGKEKCDVTIDITKDIELPESIDILINFAAALGGKSDDAILENVRTNVLGVLNLCAAAKKDGIKHIVQISSIYTLSPIDSPGYSIYSLTKRQADELAEFYCRKNDINLTILRPSQVYGDSNAFAKNQPFFYQMIDSAQKGEDIKIFGDHDPLRNYLHINDLAEVIGRVVNTGLGGTYACMYPSDVSFSQVAQAAQKTFGAHGSVIFLKNRPAIEDSVFPKDLEIYQKLNYQPQISVDSGIARIKDYREAHR